MAIHIEEDFHPKEHITKHLTGAIYNLIRERTRINSWEEQDYLLWVEYKAKTLGVDFYQIGADIYQGLKISKDGLSREEDVEVMRGVLEDDLGKDIGQKIFKKVFGGQEKEKGDGSQ